MTLRDDLNAEVNPKVRAALKAEHLRALWSAEWVKDLTITRRVGAQIWAIVFDAPPELIRDKQGEPIGIDAMVRVFRNGVELRIDPHRICINPPVLVPDGTTRTVVDAVTGDQYETDNFELNPREAYLRWLVESIRDNPNSAGWRTRGTVTTVYATAPGGNGSVFGSSTTYATARSTALAGSANHLVGQSYIAPDYTCAQAHVIFDTSAIPDTDTVSGVVLSMDGSTNSSTIDCILGVGVSTYNGGAVATGDWVAGASLPASIATWNTSGYSAAYNAFTSAGAAFNSAINLTGDTALVIFAENHRDNVAPSDSETVRFTDADAAGTTSDPKLDITHAAGGGGTLRRYSLSLTGVG